MRGPAFPDEYEVVLTLDADSLDHALDQYPSQLADVVFLGEGDDLMAYAIGPFNCEVVKFGREWRSPES